MKKNRFVQIVMVIAILVSGLQYNASVGYAADPCTKGKNVDRSFWFEVVNRLNQSSYTEYTISDYAFAIEALNKWTPNENTDACWNPLATTWDTGDGNWTNFNSLGVKSYTMRASGIKGTTATISKYNTANPNMWAIRQMLARKGFDEAAITKALNVHTSNGAYVAGLVSTWKSLYNNWKSTPISWKGNSSFVLDVKDVSRNTGMAIHLWTNVNGLNQKWQLKKQSDGTYQIISLNSGKCLDLKDGNTSNGARLQQWDCVNGNTNQKWTLTNVSGYYLIKSKTSGKCIDLQNGSATNGAVIQTWTCNSGNKNQLWKLTLP